ncbi:MAG: PadR family transcriptional regulator, partial [Streptosporangiaceae bacterium]
VVLGLVSIRPMTGYELTAYAKRSIGNFFPLTRSHIYAELDRLGRLGLLDATEIEQENAPTKRVHEITPAGREELRRWLENPEIREDRARSQFLVRIFFGDRLSPGQLAALLEDFESRTVIRRDLLAAISDKLAERPASVFRRSTAMFGVRREQAMLDWVAEARPMLLAASAAGARTPGRAG